MITQASTDSNNDSLSIQPSFIITRHESNFKRGLYQQHYDECLRRGLTPEAIAKLVNTSKLCSFTIEQGDSTRKLPNFSVLINGEELGDVMVFKSGDKVFQIKPDKEFYDKGKRIKYLSPKSAPVVWCPEGFGNDNKLKVITEGFFDAALATVLGGIPTAALAGVNHYQKAIRQDLSAVIVFDADALTNPSVISALYTAGKYSNNKIQTIPPIEGQPKAGLEEFFKAGNGAEEYKALIDSAVTPLRFLYRVMDGELPEDERKFRLVKQVCTLAARNETQEDTWALFEYACKKAGIRGELKALVKKHIQSAFKMRERIRQALSKQQETNKPVLKKDSDIYREAEALLDSGKFFDKVAALLNLSGVKMLDDHIKLDLIGSIGVITNNIDQLVHIKYTARTGQGKSVAQDFKGELMPTSNYKEAASITLAHLKRAGSRFSGVQLGFDEMTSIFASPELTSFFKQIMSKGKATIMMTEPVDGKHEAIEFEVEGLIGVSMCSTEQTQQETLGTHEDELMNRCLEIGLPSSVEYTKAINKAAILGGKPKALAQVDSRSLEVIRQAILIATSRPTSRFDDYFMECFLQFADIEVDSISRFYTTIRALLLNCSALLGKDTVGIEAYSVIYPLLDSIAQNKTTSSNPENFTNLQKLAMFELKSQSSCGRMEFTVIHLKEVFLCGKTAAYTKRDKLIQAEWIAETEQRGKYVISTKGKAVVDKGLLLTQIIPKPEDLGRLHQLVKDNSALVETNSALFRPIPPIFRPDAENENLDTVRVVEYIYNNLYIYSAIPEKTRLQILSAPELSSEANNNFTVPHSGSEADFVAHKLANTLPSNTSSHFTGAEHRAELGGITRNSADKADKVAELETMGYNFTRIKEGDNVFFCDPVTQARTRQKVLQIIKADIGGMDRVIIGIAGLPETHRTVDAIHLAFARTLS